MSEKLASIDAEVLAMASHGSYTATEIVETEHTLLKTLGWRLCQPSAMEVARHVVVMFAGVVLDNKSSSVLRAPSTVAIAAVSNSIELLDFSSRERRSFARILASLAGGVVEKDGVEGSRGELRDAFDGRWMGGDNVDVLTGADASSDASVATSTLGHSVHSKSYSRRSPVAVDDEEDGDVDVGFVAPRPPLRRTSAAAARGSRNNEVAAGARAMRGEEEVIAEQPWATTSCGEEGE